MLSKDSNVLVVGAGCFGISTAYHLLKRGYTRVTIIDRGDPLPAVDAASTDMNKSMQPALFWITSLAQVICDDQLLEPPMLILSTPSLRRRPLLRGKNLNGEIHIMSTGLHISHLCTSA